MSERTKLKLYKFFLTILSILLFLMGAILTIAGIFAIKLHPEYLDISWLNVIFSLLAGIFCITVGYGFIKLQDYLIEKVRTLK